MSHVHPDPTKRRNRQINLTVGTAVAVIAFLMVFFILGGILVWNLHREVNDLRGEGQCRTTLDINVQVTQAHYFFALGTLITDVTDSFIIQHKVDIDQLMRDTAGLDAAYVPYQTAIMARDRTDQICQ